MSPWIRFNSVSFIFFSTVYDVSHIILEFADCFFLLLKFLKNEGESLIYRVSPFFIIYIIITVIVYGLISILFIICCSLGICSGSVLTSSSFPIFCRFLLITVLSWLDFLFFEYLSFLFWYSLAII